VKKKLPTDALIKKFLGKDFDPRKLKFQTKDLENVMLTYEIRENGDLYLKRIEYRDSTPEEQAEDKKKLARFSAFTLKVASQKWQKTDYTGDIHFYSYDRNKADDRYYALDYKAHVVKGKVKRIKLEKTERESDKEQAARIETDKKLVEHMRLHNEKVSKLSYKIINFLYNKPTRFVLRKAQRYLQNLPAFLFKLEQKILY
jgi:hypothetical protein